MTYRYHFSWHVAEAPGLHVAAAEMRPGEGLILHDHDYCELFWVSDGSGFHLVGDRRERLNRGDLVFIRPEDVHGFACGDHGFSIMNIVIEIGLAERLRAWLAADGIAWPWRPGQQPLRLTLEETRLRALARLLADAHLPGGSLERDVLLLGILRIALAPADSDPRSDPLPGWLATALAGFDAAGGVHDLFRRCGRSREHVNRTIRRCHGCTASTLVNRLRCDAAARRLRLCHDPIPAVAAAAGFNDLAHFYRCFSARHGCPPRAYRLRHRAPV